MNKNLKRLKTVKILRDIFLSSNSKELYKAFQCLKKEIFISELELESDFNHYFIGPTTPIASLYASVYFEEDTLMSQTTMDIRNLYEIMGFENSLKNKTPEDFLGLELDAYYQLLYIEIEKNIFYLKDLRVYFLHEHINLWIFKFIDKVKNYSNKNSKSINLIIEELNIFFKNELNMKGDIL